VDRNDQDISAFEYSEQQNALQNDESWQMPDQQEIEQDNEGWQ
jgi:hypothetical protein